MNAREVAWRIFAGEMSDSSKVVTGNEERAPTYVITPLGAKVNRVYIVGVVTDLENVGTPDEPRWRAKIIDPTGTSYISAGQFQPEAATAMSKLTVPGFAAIIGKVRVYSPEEGVMYINIQPETVKSVDRTVRDSWIMDGCLGLKHRIEAMTEARKMAEASLDALMKLGYSQNLSQGILAAMEHYGDIPLDRYKSMLVDSLRYLIPEEGGSPDIPEPGAAPEPEEDDYDEFEEGIDIPATPPAVQEDSFQDDDEELTENERKLYDIIGKADPKKAGIDWTQIEKLAKKAGLKDEAYEEAAGGLLEKGLIYEPVMTKVRII